MNNHTYKLRYKLEPWTGSADEARAQTKEGWGACDAMLVASIIYPEDGSLSVSLASKDGRTGNPLDDIECLKVWTMLARQLGESKTLPEVQRDFCFQVFEAYRLAMLAAREKEERTS